MDPLAAAAELAAALAALHREGRVHGRIHRGNVLREGGRLALREVPAPTGTLPAPEADLDALACAAPELLRGRGATRASDVHALALVVAELLAGRPRETPASVEEAVHAGLHRPALALGAAVPPRVARLLRRASSRRARWRPSAAALARALGEASRRPQGARSSPLLAPQARAPEPARPARPVEVPAPAPRTWGALALRRLATRRRALAAAAAVALVAGGALALARRPGALERAVAARLEARDLDGARRLLREAERRGGAGPVAEKLRGDVACAGRAYGECLRRYEAALAARPALGRDPRLRENALALAARGDDRRALAAVLARLPGLDDALAELTRSPRYWPRWNAVRALEARGARDRIDFARVYALDLLHAGSCDTRRAAAERLAALREPRLLPELTRAQAAARASWSEWRCTGPAVEEALRATRQARVAVR
ncbi:serine/threonine protein kinase [Anaeromyxobacter diazotrophicus]|uniref:serine/threonine protein kinase n=1 Tax=Anaeromyxobacter diazotrophicus TaxID=2590199 RepID=UPI001591E28D|nr:serine/threonine protein kinase [Anaeromyxobacter diazotrophicus]